MGFSDDFAACMSPLPVPSLDGLDEVAEFLDKVHNAWESAGGNDEVLLSALVAAGAVTGIDEAALGTAAALTVGAYLAACAGCLASVLASDVWDAITAPVVPDWLQQALTVAANEKNIPQKEQVA
jgi:hypothetical protein